MQFDAILAHAGWLVFSPLLLVLGFPVWCGVWGEIRVRNFLEVVLLGVSVGMW